MEIKELKSRPNLDHYKKLDALYIQFNDLLKELRKRKVPHEIVILINSGIDEINSTNEIDKLFTKHLKKTQSAFLKLIEKELKLVTKNHYRNTWLAIGMSVFGMPIGVVLGSAMGNMGLLGVGLSIGMLIGIILGSDMDKKALEAGRQLDLEIKY